MLHPFFLQFFFQEKSNSSEKEYIFVLIVNRPFQRTAVENDQIFNILKHFPAIAEQCSSDVLRELCVMAHLDIWKEKEVTSMNTSCILKWHNLSKIILETNFQLNECL